MHTRRYRVLALGIALFFTVAGSVWPSLPLAHADGDTVDEIHYSYGNDATSVVFDWHGQEQNIYYGLDTTYGSQAVAGNSPYIPFDMAGPFREIRLTGLQAGTAYHYRIGLGGLDHTFSTEPTGDYTSVDIGDSMSSSCPNPNSSTYMPQMQQLIAAQNPDFVTHGGDIAIANQCGQQAVHRLYTDIEAWSHNAAFQVAWGNHEYGPRTTSPPAPAGTPANDSLVSYKARDRMSNGQTVPNDRSTQLKHPGCGQEIGSTTNTCMGDDWGYFTAGHVLYISYPEPDTGALADWRTKADSLMAAAQADPNIDFIITWGHRPAYTSSTQDITPDLRTALDGLAAKYSPAVGNLNGLNGKYVMEIQHHAHTFETFSPKHGLTYITDGAGGQGFSNWATIDPDSLTRMLHFGVLVTKYVAATHTMKVSFVCGSDFVNIKDTCAYGTVIPVTTFVSSNGGQATPPSAAVTTTLGASSNNVQVGQQLTYTAGVQNTVADSMAAGANLSVTVPSNLSIVSATGATIAGNTATWNLGNLQNGPATTKQLTAQLTSGTVGDSFTATATTTTTDATCSATGSACAASTTGTVAATPTSIEWIGNQSFEGSSTGWAGKYNTTSMNTRVAGGYDGAYAFRSVNNTSATGATGFIDNPHWLDGTAGKTTTAGTTYTGTIWVRADVANEKISLYLRELSPSNATVGSKTISITAANTTDWFLITNPYKAVGSGNSLGFYVYTSSVAAHKGFNADLVSLISPN